MNIYKYIKYIFLFQYLYSATSIILYYDQQMHNYFTNYHTPKCFDTIVSPQKFAITTLPRTVLPRAAFEIPV